MSTRYVPIACLRFPRLPILAHHPKADPSESLVVHERGRIVFCNASARGRGIRPGQSLAVAQTHDASVGAKSLKRDLLVAAHRRVSRALVELSPRVSESRLAVFWAEPFGEDWCERALAVFRDGVRIGLAPDATTAYAAACWTKSILAVPPEDARTFLDRSPIAVLELSAKARRGLGALGIRTVGELRAFDPTSLAMRLGPEVAEAWHRADGNDPRGPRFQRARDPDEAELELDEPLHDRGVLAQVLAPMLSGLARRARDRDRAIVEVRVRLDTTGSSTGVGRPFKDSHTRAHNRHESGSELVVPLGAPTTDAGALGRALRDKLEAIRGEVRRIRVAVSTVPHARTTEPLLGPSEAGLRAALLTRLAERMEVRRASVCDAADILDTATWVDSSEDTNESSAPPWAWRAPLERAAVIDGRVDLAGRPRKIVRLGRHQRVSKPWWDGRAFPATEVCAWAELEGPVLALLRETANGWEVVGWLD